MTPPLNDTRALLHDLQLLVEAESPSEDIGALTACAQVVANLGERYIGRRPTEHTASDGRVHLEWRGSGPEPRVGVLGHMDTVWPVGTLESRSWERDDSVVRGPGIFDMKAGLVQAFAAVGALNQSERDRVDVLVTADEEIGAPTSGDLIVQFAQRVSAVLVVEPAAGSAVKIGRKGNAFYEIDIHGVAAHAGLEPERGVNATIEAARTVMALDQLNDLEAGTTVTPTRLVSGDRVNVVPDHATVSVDVRTRSVSEANRVDRAISALASGAVPSVNNAVAGVVTKCLVSSPPLELPMSTALFERACAIAATLGMPDLEGVSVGGASDGNITASHGTPTLDGLGAVGGGAHAADEHVSIRDIAERVALLHGLIADVLRYPIALRGEVAS
jgi:glutamate carboxypeptidase